MKEHKTDKNITKYKKLNDAALAEHKTEMNITKNEKYEKKK